MVYINYTIECSCGEWNQNSVESGDSDGYNTTFECSHFCCKIYQTTDIGWLLGGNAEINLCFYPKCLQCNYKYSVYNPIFWGWNNNDALERTYKCCGHQLAIRCQESNHWAKFIFDGVVETVRNPGQLPFVTISKLIINSIPGTYPIT